MGLMGIFDGVIGSSGGVIGSSRPTGSVILNAVKNLKILRNDQDDISADTASRVPTVMPTQEY